MALYKTVDGVRVELTAEEIAQREADEAAWNAEAEPRRIKALWQEANKLALQFGHNDRAKALSWKIDGSPQWRLDRIAAIDAWMDTIWQAYYVAKATPGATTIGPIDPIPYTFADLIEE